MFPPHAFMGVVVKGAGHSPQFSRGLLARLKAVLWLEKAPWDTALQLELVSLSDMQRVSFESRGIDRPTDVLTFAQPYTDSTVMNDILFPFGDGTAGLSSDLPSAVGPVIGSDVRADLVDLGVIYMCVPYIAARCFKEPTKNLPLSMYLDAALVHAELHALGYDHKTPLQLRDMARREQQLGRQLRALSRRHPSLIPSLDVLEYLQSISSR